MLLLQLKSMETSHIFLDAINKHCSPNLTAVTSAGFSGGSGRKGDIPKRKRKHPVPIESRSVRQCLQSPSDLKEGKIGFKGGKVPPPYPYVENTLTCNVRYKITQHNKHQHTKLPILQVLTFWG